MNYRITELVRCDSRIGHRRDRSLQTATIAPYQPPNNSVPLDSIGDIGEIYRRKPLVSRVVRKAAKENGRVFAFSQEFSLRGDGIFSDDQRRREDTETERLAVPAACHPLAGPADKPAACPYQDADGGRLRSPKKPVSSLTPGYARLSEFQVSRSKFKVRRIQKAICLFRDPQPEKIPGDSGYFLLFPDNGEKKSPQDKNRVSVFAGFCRFSRKRSPQMKNPQIKQSRRQIEDPACARGAGRRNTVF